MEEKPAAKPNYEDSRWIFSPSHFTHYGYIVKYNTGIRWTKILIWADGWGIVSIMMMIGINMTNYIRG
jgi:hypothetical protein